MRSGAPVLLPLLRSQVQGDLLALLYLHPELEYSLTEAADAIGSNVKVVHVEASRLVDAGLLKERRRGNVRLLRAALDTPVAGPLTDLLAVTYGPLPVLTELLGFRVGIDRAFIYGSWAARYRGEPGPVPVDIDVLVVGTVDRDELHDLAGEAEQILARPVNIYRINTQVWDDTDLSDPFIASVKQRPLVELNLHGAKESNS